VEKGVRALSAFSSSIAVSSSDVPLLLLGLLAKHPSIIHLPSEHRWHTLGSAAASVTRCLAQSALHRCGDRRVVARILGPFRSRRSTARYRRTVCRLFRLEPNPWAQYLRMSTARSLRFCERAAVPLAEGSAATLPLQSAACVEISIRLLALSSNLRAESEFNFEMAACRGHRNETRLAPFRGADVSKILAHRIDERHSTCDCD